MTDGDILYTTIFLLRSLILNFARGFQICISSSTLIIQTGAFSCISNFLKIQGATDIEKTFIFAFQTENVLIETAKQKGPTEIR